MKNSNKQMSFQELADKVIVQAKKAGATESRISLSKRRLVEINYRERKPDIIREASTQDLYLEVFMNNKYARQSTPDFRTETLEQFIKETVANAGIMEEDPYRTLPDPELYSGRNTDDIQVNDPDYNLLTPEKRHEAIRTTEEACLSAGGDKVISVEAGGYDERSEEYIRSSNGFEGSASGTMFQVYATMSAQDEGDRRPQDYQYAVCRFLSDLPSLEQIGTEAAARTLDLFGAGKIKSGNFPVIIENRVSERLVGFLLPALSGSNIQQKRSFLADKKGAKIGSALFSVYDDPFIRRGLGSRYYDGDGFASRRRDLFTDGVLNEFMIDWYYSRKLGWQPTSGSYSNLVIPAGNRSIQDIIKDLPKCLLITGFIGGNSNSTTGDFSVGIFGKLYEKGQFRQNVAEMNIAGNHLTFWNKLIEVSNDTWNYSNVLAPGLVFENVAVSGI